MNVRLVKILWLIVAALQLTACGLLGGAPEEDQTLAVLSSDPHFDLPPLPGPTPEPPNGFSSLCVAFYSFDHPAFNPTAPVVNLFDPKEMLLRSQADWTKVHTGADDECSDTVAPPALTHIPTYMGSRPNGVPTTSLPPGWQYFFQGAVFNGIVALADVMNAFDHANPPPLADEVTLPLLREIAPYIDQATGCAITLAIENMRASTTYTDPATDPPQGEYHVGGLLAVMISKPLSDVTSCAGFTLAQGSWGAGDPTP